MYIWPIDPGGHVKAPLRSTSIGMAPSRFCPDFVHAPLTGVNVDALVHDHDKASALGDWN
jgi:hypothetical protein